jgi:hypothetical protein
MRTEVRDGVLSVTTDGGDVLRMIAHDDIATAQAIGFFEDYNGRFARFALAILANMQRELPFTAMVFCKRVIDASEYELLTGRRDPALHGENIAILPSLCQCCFDRLPVSATSTICPTCTAVLWV